MNNNNVVRWTGIFGIIGGILLLLEIPLWIIPGDGGALADAAAHAAYLGDIRIIALLRIFIDMFMYMTWMVFFAGLRQVIINTKKEYEWIGTLVFGAGIVWWTVSLVADGLEGGAVLLTIGNNTNPESVKTLVYGTLLIYNSSIAFAVTGFFMGTVGFAILSTHALPGWIGWLSWTGFVLCILSIPSMFINTVDTTGFYNVAGWGPVIIANLTPLLLIFAISIAMIQKMRGKKQDPAR
jgi:hypothetical protein